MNLKRLDLDMWMATKWMLDDVLSQSTDYRPIEPRIGKPGRYLLGDECWFELPDGRAFTAPASGFRFDLARLQSWHLSEAQVLALRAIVKAKLATKRQRQMLYHRECAEAGRDIYRGSRKCALAFIRGMR